MPQFINFFPRQVVMGNSSTSGDIYSDVYDVSEAKSITGVLSGYVASGGDPTAQITLQGTDDPSFVTFTNLTGEASGLSGVGSETLKWGSPKRFVRAKLAVSGNSFMVVSFSAQAVC